MGTSTLASGLMTSLMAMVQPFTLLPLAIPVTPRLDSPFPSVIAHLGNQVCSA